MRLSHSLSARMLMVEQQAIPGAVAMSNTVRVSFEFFPPNDDEMTAHLWAAVQRLAPLQPEFVSVTYGADGSTGCATWSRCAGMSPVA